MPKGQFKDGTGGPDTLVADPGADTLNGLRGDDRLEGMDPAVFDPDADVLKGGEGEDSLYGDNGDRMTGGSFETDFFYVLPGGKPVVILDAQSEAQAGDSADEIVIMVPVGASADMEGQLATSIAANGRDLEVHLGTIVVAVLRGQAGQHPNVSLDYFSDTGGPWGGFGDDTVTGSSTGDFLYGGGGNDRVVAGGGDDFANDGSGNDRIYLGSGNDWFLGTQENTPGDNDDIHGGAGRDSIESYVGSDTVHGDAGDDLILTEDYLWPQTVGSDFVSGGTGDDSIYADGSDTVAGNDGADEFHIWATGLVTIKDFTAGEDHLFLAAPGGAGEVTFELAENGRDTMVLFGGTAVVALAGVLPSEISPDDWSL